MFVGSRFYSNNTTLMENNMISENLIPFAKQQMEAVKALSEKKFKRLTTPAIREHIDNLNADGYIMATTQQVVQAGLVKSIQDTEDQTQYAWGLMMPTLASEKIKVYPIMPAEQIPGVIKLLINPCQIGIIEKMIAAAIETYVRMEDNGNDDGAKKFRSMAIGASFVLEALGLLVEGMDETLIIK
jgi:hypothetical protein